jgi:hypothetical protein
MQYEIILFQKQEYTVNVDEHSYEGILEHDHGGNGMIVIKAGTIDSIQLTLMQMVDNARTALNLVTSTGVVFTAVQKHPAINRGDPSPPKVIVKNCTIINAAHGIVTVDFLAIDTTPSGVYDCEVEVNYPTTKIYCKHSFEMTIR